MLIKDRLKKNLKKSALLLAIDKSSLTKCKQRTQTLIRYKTANYKHKGS